MIIEAMVFGAFITFILLGLVGVVLLLDFIFYKLPIWAKPIMFWFLMFVLISIAAYIVKVIS